MFLIKKKLSFLTGFTFFFLVCLCVFPSTSLGYTFYDLVDYCYILKDYQGATNDQKNLANWVINNQTTIINRIGANIYQYDSWQIDKMTYSRGGQRVYGFQGGSFNGWNQKQAVKNYTARCFYYFC